MSNIQKTLDSLQPYVIGIRYLDGTVLVDAVFKEGWTVPEDANIKKVKGDESLNYHMIFSENPKIGLDELLGYVGKVIQINLEREKKHDLLRAKFDELKALFKKTDLAKLQRLKFTFTGEDLVPSLNDFDMDIEEEVEQLPAYAEEAFEEEIIEPTPIPQTVAFLDENRNPIELTEEERELAEEDARAERNRRILENKKRNPTPTTTKKPNKVELPPKRKVEMANAEPEYYTDCDCGPNDACDKCIDSKGY